MRSVIIPMLVQACACGRARPSQKDVPVMAPDYKNALFTSVLGSQNTPGVAQTASPLKAGIHLHFILPDAFTHSADGSDYPAAPNRFAVARIWPDKNSGRLLTRVFVVESDFISTSKSYADSITIPFFSDPDPRKKWRYLGRSYPAGQAPPLEKGDAYLGKITAIGPGDPLFAAYYPNCAGVFGFYDALADLPPAPSITLAYFVMGYFSSPEADPFYGAGAQEDFARVLEEMRLSVSEPQDLCRGCLLYGSAGAMEWKGFEAEYCPAPQGRVDVVFGCTSAEALSTAVKNSLSQTNELTERMLTALQYELYDQKESLDANFKIDDEIHLQSFSRLDGFDEICRVSLDKNVAVDSARGMGAAYAAVKKLGSELGACRRALAFERRKLFSIWEQYVLLYENEDQPRNACPAREAMLEEIRRICAGIEARESEIKEKTDDYMLKAGAFSSSLPAGADCGKGAGEPFFGAKNPVLLLSGPGLNRSYAYGEDGRFRADGLLPCQTEPLSAAADPAQILSRCFSDLPLEALPLPFGGLLLQTAFIWPELLARVKAVMGDIAITGEKPCRAAVNTAPFEWTTLFMIWGLAYHPTRISESGDDTLGGWRLEYGDTNLVYGGGLNPEQLKPRRIAGKMVLTPHAVKTMAGVIKRHGELYGDEEQLKALADKIKNFHVISQNLSGFSDYFSGLRQTLQFPVTGIGEDPAIARTVADKIGNERLSIAPDAGLLPLRGGYARLTDLSLVGSFGQMQVLAQSSYYNDCEVDFAETVACGHKGYGLLAPCFSVPARLNAEFVSATDKEIPASAAPETSPVCGIAIPEILNRRLLAYTPQGGYLGMVKTALRGGRATARWLSAPGLPPDFDQLEIPHGDFRLFLKRLLIDDGAFQEFNALLFRYLDLKHNSGSLIWGRPLILAKARLEFEFFGGPEFSKRYEDFGKYDSQGAEAARFQLGVGDIGRVADGLLGYFADGDYAGMYAPYGAQNPCGTENYVRYSRRADLAAADGGRYFTLLMEPDSPVHIQTGILPVYTLNFEPAHAKTAQNLALSAEIAPVLGAPGQVGLPPMPMTEKNEAYAWHVLQKGNYIKSSLVSPTVSFEETVLMDGLLVKERA